MTERDDLNAGTGRILDSDLQLQKLSKLFAHFAARSHGYRAFESLEEDVLNLALRSFGDRFDVLKVHATELAGSLLAAPGVLSPSEKKLLSKVEWRFQGPWVYLPHDQMSSLRACLGQVFRNFVAHGLFVAGGEGQGVSGSPWFSLSWSIQESGLEFTIEDSGPGLEIENTDATQSWESVCRKLSAQVFAPGFSSTVPSGIFSGQGMGMSYVLEEMRRWGGDAVLVLPDVPPDEGMKRVPFRLKCYFRPKSWVFHAHYVEGDGGAALLAAPQKVSFPEGGIEMGRNSKSPALFLPVSGNWVQAGSEVGISRVQWGGLWGDPPELLLLRFPDSA